MLVYVSEPADVVPYWYPLAQRIVKETKMPTREGLFAFDLTVHT